MHFGRYASFFLFSLIGLFSLCYAQSSALEEPDVQQLIEGIRESYEALPQSKLNFEERLDSLSELKLEDPEDLDGWFAGLKEMQSDAFVKHYLALVFYKWLEAKDRRLELRHLSFDERMGILKIRSRLARDNSNMAALNQNLSFGDDGRIYSEADIIDWTTRFIVSTFPIVDGFPELFELLNFYKYQTPDVPAWSVEAGKRIIAGSLVRGLELHISRFLKWENSRLIVEKFFEQIQNAGDSEYFSNPDWRKTRRKILGALVKDAKTSDTAEQMLAESAISLFGNPHPDGIQLEPWVLKEVFSLQTELRINLTKKFLAKNPSLVELEQWFTHSLPGSVLQQHYDKIHEAQMNSETTEEFSGKFLALAIQYPELGSIQKLAQEVHSRSKPLITCFEALAFGLGHPF